MANTLKLGAGKWATGTDTVLAFNDTNNNFKPLPFNFSRASSATVVNQSGLIETVGSGTPRIDFLGNTKGAMLLEPSRTNSLPYSENFSQWSTASGASVVGNKLGIGGSNDAFEFLSNGSASTRLYYTVSVTGLSSYSVFAKKNTLDYISLYANDDNNARVWFNLANGTLGNQEAGGTGNIESYGNGWYRCTMHWNSSNLVNVRIYNSNENDVVGGTAGSVFIQYAQLEAGNYATSYIPTSGSAVTRVAETCNNGANSEVINSTEGVLYAEISALANDGTTRAISINDGSTDNFVQFSFRPTTNSIRYRLESGNALQFSNEEIVTDTSTFNKIALVYGNNNFALWSNGVRKFLITNALSPINLSNLDFDNGEDGSPFYGNVKDIKLYNTVLTDAELQALTTI